MLPEKWRLTFSLLHISAWDHLIFKTSHEALSYFPEQFYFVLYCSGRNKIIKKVWIFAFQQSFLLLSQIWSNLDNSFSTLSLINIAMKEIDGMVYAFNIKFWMVGCLSSFHPLLCRPGNSHPLKRVKFVGKQQTQSKKFPY